MQIDRQTRSIAAVIVLFAAVFLTSDNVVASAPVRRWGMPLLLYFIGGGLLLWNWYESRPASDGRTERADSAARALTVREFVPPREPAPVPAPVREQKAQVAPQTEAPPATPPRTEKPAPVAEPPAEPAPPAEASAPVAAPRKAAEPPAAKPRRKGKSDGDDLTVVEGIGPKINDALKKAGITTYAALAETTEARLREILDASGLRIVGSVSATVPTWPHQAGLAAAENWSELETWKAEHKAGK